ncbi:MAG: YceI family protein [Bacteroidales bacterium]|nr:MAG: YceI family protein [Bacteroidales bacterium]
MKTKQILLAALTLLFVGVVNAQNFKVDVDKSELKWVGKKVTGQHNGKVKLADGVLAINNNKITSGTFSIDMKSITDDDLTDAGYNQKLVGHLKSDDFFGVEKFPTATLLLTESVAFENSSADVKGKLTIKGITNPISFKVIKNGNTYTTSIAVDRSKYDVRYGSGSFFENLGDKAISDIFTLDVVLVVE